MRMGLLIGAALVLAGPALAATLPDGVPDFVAEGTHASRLVCDRGASELNGYDMGAAGWGLTITVDGNVAYYVFSPNPDSMSPITFSYEVVAPEQYELVTMEERNAKLATAAPNLHAAFGSQRSDCKAQLPQ